MTRFPRDRSIEGSCPVAETIRAAAAIPVPPAEALPRDPIRLPGGAGNTTRGEGVRRGVGFAVGFKNICYSEGFDDSCAARVVLRADGSAEVHCAAAEVGQGVVGVILQVARTELGTDAVTLDAAHDSDGRFGRICVRLAHDLDGRGRCAGRVPSRARGARANGRGRGGRGARAPTSTDDAARSRDGSDHRRARARRACVLGDARRRRGRRRARPHARRLDRDSAGRRSRGQSHSPSRARSRAARRRASGSR